MQRSIGFAGALFTVALATVGLTAPHAATAADPGPRVINMTPDSAPGWYPSEALEQEARKAALDYLAAMDEGRYGDAYAMLTKGNRREPLAAFSERLASFNREAGAVKERRIVTVTWTADPAQAPMKGKYAAIDLISRFAKVDRHCGYLVMYQPPSGGGFQVMRTEDNFLADSQAAAIAKDGSDAAVQAAWAKLSARCPGYAQSSRPAATPASSATSPTPLAEASSSTIGYATAEAALTALRAKPGVTITLHDGWTVADDGADHAIWSFTPPGHPAYPAAVKRQVVEKDGQMVLDMQVLCHASKAACDDLVRAFQKLNAEAMEQARGHH